MPSWPPRSDTTKKREQLLKKQQELLHAIRHDLPGARLERVAENLRAAQLALLKAKLHWLKEPRMPPRSTAQSVQKIELEIQTWIEKPVEDILRWHPKAEQ